MTQPAARLTVQGRRDDTPQDPTFLRRSSRSASGAEDPFLPPGYVRTTTAVAVAGSQRGGGERASHALDAGEVIVLELDNGFTFVGNARRLRDALRDAHPELIGADGEVDLARLPSQAGTSRSVVGDLVGALVQKAFSLVVGAAPDAIIEQARRKLAEVLGQKVGQVAELGVTWAGTKALMWAVEKQLADAPGLYRWAQADKLEKVDLRREAPRDPARAPMLVFVHGTASSSFGSFSELRNGDASVWAALEARYTGGIYALEHRTMSESPIDNAIALAEALPDGAHVSLVSHSRGGLVADLLCLDPDAPELAQAIEAYQYRYAGTGDADPAEAERVLEEMKAAHAEHRAQLTRLRGLLRARGLVIQRYVRAAAPAAGTKLAGANIDLFLSGLLTLIGMVPVFFGSPLYSAVRRIVLEIAKNRTDPHLVPGIEAMLPDSPMAPFLRTAAPRAGIRMALLAGDIEGGGPFKRLGVLLTNFLFFDNTANDLVVDTPAMLAGVAARSNARVLFDRGPEVSHFRYFVNQTTRVALRDWLVSDEAPDARALPASAPLRLFRELPAPGQFEQALQEALRRDATGADRPVVILLPGVMGSHLAGGGERIWFNPLALAAGGLADLGLDRPGVATDELFGLFYGKLREHLSRTHVVLPFAYDWRQPLDVLAQQFSAFVKARLAETTQPIRLVAHSMGGLVIRAAIHHDRATMDALMARDGARLLMLGTPNQGSHSMVENLLGKGEMLRTLVALDLKHDLQQVLDIVAGFRGPLQLLPKPGFVDDFQATRPGEPAAGGQAYAYQSAQTWADFKVKVRDRWFGSGRCAVPSQAALDQASWLWRQDGPGRPALPDAYRERSIYVFGVARQTACGVRDDDGRLRLVATPHGDGTVTWASGRIDGIGQYYYMPGVAHGDLLATPAHFEAIVELLEQGRTRRLDGRPPASRAIDQPVATTYDAGPPGVADADAAARAVLGAVAAGQLEATPPHRLSVSVCAQDLRHVRQPILVGHYERDPIAGPQKLIDSELLDGELAERLELGLYPGPRGSAIAVLRAPNEQERKRGTLTGAVVTGLGDLGSALSVADLTDAVRTGVIRYLLQVVDVLGKGDRETLGLASLLLGHNSSLNLSIADSVEAIVRGVLEGNDRFAAVTRQNLRVTHLEIVELYLDSAITAAHRLRELGPLLSERARALGTRLEIGERLEEGRGVRPRLFERPTDNYWPRLIVSDATRDGTTLKTLAGAGAEGTPAEPTRQLGERLRFVYVGPRARAESMMLQRQPGFIELLIRRRMVDGRWQEDFGRLLFQLLVPPDFKEAARVLDRVVLVVDSYTANLPWELMLADDPSGRAQERLPLAVRTPVVRQLASSSFRRIVRSFAREQALVIGNPSVEDFTTHFRSSGGGPLRDLPALANAETEAESVAAVLGSLGFDVQTVIGEEQDAATVLAALYRQPWRVLHISAHGVFQQRHVHGDVRSGVVLSDGYLITAAEIKAMESVPELVFLNCCHLGAIEVGLSEQGNELAASLARELIEMGVRCVVVAGWAVDDKMAARFGQVFYECLLSRGLAFGDAVFEARKAAWNEDPGDITWGAFQAYGDPAWKARARRGAGSWGASRFLTAHDVIDFLAGAESDIARRSSKLGAREKKARLQAVQQVLDERCPPDMRELASVRAAHGRLLLAFDEMALARDALGRALEDGDLDGRVTLRDAERLANAESRLDDLELARQAVRRLESLADLVAPARPGDVAPSQVLNAERAGLLGGAYKRQAGQLARRLLAGELDAGQSQATMVEIDQLLVASIGAYRKSAAGAGRDLWGKVNALMLQAVRAARLDDAQQREVLADVEACVASADERAAIRRQGVFDLILPCDARLALSLLRREPWQPGEVGEQAMQALIDLYSGALRSTVMLPAQLDSTVAQISLLSELVDALGSATPDDPLPMLAADRLFALATSIDPGVAANRRRRVVAASGPTSTPSAAPTAAPAPAGTARRGRAAGAQRAAPAAPKSTTPRRRKP